MNVLSNGVNEPIATPAGKEVVASRANLRRRRILVNSLRVLFLVVIVGGW